MRKMILLTAFLLIFLCSSGVNARAEGLMQRTFGNLQQTSHRTNQKAVSTRRVYRSSRSMNQSRSRLPAGRSYYQGRYYGNFNNRFYGPQYGYF